jgi:hypothetical protein
VGASDIKKKGMQIALHDSWQGDLLDGMLDYINLSYNDLELRKQQARTNEIFLCFYGMQQWLIKKENLPCCAQLHKNTCRQMVSTRLSMIITPNGGMIYSNTQSKAIA